MFDRLDQLEARYEDLGRQLSDPTLVNDQKKFQTTAKAHRDLEPVVEKFRQYRNVQTAIGDARAMTTDPRNRSQPRSARHGRRRARHPRAAARRP